MNLFRNGATFSYLSLNHRSYPSAHLLIATSHVVVQLLALELVRVELFLASQWSYSVITRPPYKAPPTSVISTLLPLCFLIMTRRRWSFSHDLRIYGFGFVVSCMWRPTISTHDSRQGIPEVLDFIPTFPILIMSPNFFQGEVDGAMDGMVKQFPLSACIF